MSNEVTLDFARKQRIGIAEAVLCEKKSLPQLLSIMEQLQEKGETMLFTRLDEKMFHCLQDAHPQGLDYDPVSRTAWFHPQSSGLPLIPDSDQAEIAVITGGSSDVPVAREAVRTLHFNGRAVLEVNDVGVAGLWRLQAHLERLRTMKVIICVAGMDAALPTVLGGLVPSLIIGVPSSVGYGMAKDGETALQSMLCSCAQGLAVVNIDNGYGAACAALRALARA